MAVREVPKDEYTKDGRKWIYEVRVKGRRIKSKKFMTKKEAMNAERELLNNSEKIGNQSMMTLYDLFEDHYNYQKGKVKYTTLYNYQKRYHHFKSIYNIKLNDLNIKHIEMWKKEMDELGLVTGTKNDLMKYLKCTLNYGTKWHDFNFSQLYNKLTNFYDPDEIPKEMEFYTYEEFSKFISVEDDLKFKVLFETLYYEGLRKGELRALQWKNIDFLNKEINITHNIVNVSGDEGKWKITTPKTKTSIRQIPIPNILLNDLVLLKESYKGFYGFNDDWYVFGNIIPIHPDVIRRRKNTIAKLAGVKQIRIHDFRHSCASLLINNGANVVMVAKYLGHSKIDETLNTYSHIYKNKLDDIVNTINELEK